MPSAWGRHHNERCVCGIAYDSFRIGISFGEARRMIIAIGTDRRTGKTKYGRRHGVLGFLHELKLLSWKGHRDFCDRLADEGYLFEALA